jgi:hypothetical protein
MTKKETDSTIRQFRLNIDAMINSVQLINPSREVSLAYTNLQRAKNWLGLALKELGAPNPYPESMDVHSKAIEPQAEHSMSSLIDSFNVIDRTQTARVKFFRQHLQNNVDAFKDFEGNTEGVTPFYAQYCLQTILALQEAKMWFGWELDRIRVETTTDQNALRGREILPLI